MVSTVLSYVVSMIMLHTYITFVPNSKKNIYIYAIIGIENCFRGELFTLGADLEPRTLTMHSIFSSISVLNCLMYSVMEIYGDSARKGIFRYEIRMTGNEF